jgi:integrase/recombinase XerD
MKKKYQSYRKTNFSKVYKILPKNNQIIIDKFLDYCRITAGEGSIKKISSKIIQIADTIEKDLNKITLEDLREFLRLLNQSNLSVDTSNDTKKVLKRFLKWKYEDWNKRFKGFEDIKQKRKPTKDKLSKGDLLTPEEIETLIRHSPGLREKALIMVLFETAGRPEEIYKLKWKHINFENKEMKLSSAKTGDTRNVVINQSVNRLKLYKQEYPYENVKAEDYVFPSLKGRDKPIDAYETTYLLRTLGKKYLNKKVFPYLFRHTRLNSIRKKLSPDVYQKFAGHSIDVALSHYSHIDNDDVREEMFERIYNIEELTKEDKEELKKLKDRIETQDKKIEVLLKHYGEFQDLLNDIAETGKIPIEIETQTPEESKKIKKELIEKISKI